MELTSREDGQVLVVQPVGQMAKRAAVEFERRVLELLDGGRTRVVIDCGNVEVIASEGLRTLMLLSQRLEAAGGRLALCGLRPDVRGVLDVAGLEGRFVIAEDSADAIRQVSSVGSQVGPALSTLTRLVSRLLDTSAGVSPAGVVRAGEPTALTRQVAALLGDARSALDRTGDADA
jgi:anti-anti-sigma factor